MNYRHIYHAGNFADVFKHIIFARLIEYFKRKDKAFRILDSHAGIGDYDLTSIEAKKTLEWQNGIGKLLKNPPQGELAELLASYFDVVEAQSNGENNIKQSYPGSPRIARHLIRNQDRLSLYELHKDDFETLKQNFGGDYQVKLFHLNGWQGLNAHIPPKEGRGMVLIDPPFEDGKDLDQIIESVAKMHKHWRGGTIAIWYPIKDNNQNAQFHVALKDLEIPNILASEIYLPDAAKPKAEGRMNRRPAMLGCGMIMINPPYVLHGELRKILPYLQNALAVEKLGKRYPAKTNLKWLVEE
jgi:23S rRNA (adenine2030-N6)-methyltransferase